MSVLPNRIREIRKQRNISGIDVAKAIDLSPQYYYEVERNEKGMNPEALMKFADFFDVSLDYIFLRSDLPNTKALEIIPESLKDITIAEIQIAREINNLHLSEKELNQIFTVVDIMKKYK